MARSRSFIVGLTLFFATATCNKAMQTRGSSSAIKVTELTHNLLVVATSSGNVVISVGRDGALLVGTPSVASNGAIKRLLASKTASALRYVVIAPEDLGQTQGDAGWTASGAYVAMQEKALERLGGHAMGTVPPLPPRLIQLGVDRPRVAFSEVLTFDLNGDAIHIVHQPPGYTDADSIVHFHVAKLVYMGEDYPGDGYPKIDLAQGGSLEGLLRTLAAWTDPSDRVVPVVGKVTTGESVAAFISMITAVRDDIKSKIGEGLSQKEIVASHPTARFDDRWGHGRVSPDEFVHEVYMQLTSKQ